MLVHFMNPDRDVILSALEGKKIICFGAGRRFSVFKKLHPQFPVAGVIDNYRDEDMTDAEGKTIPVWSPEGAVHQLDRNTVLLITSVALKEIVEQLDRIDGFDGISCYAEITLDQCDGLPCERACQMEEIASQLSGRTSESILKEYYGIENLTAERKKYQICYYRGIENTAATKALDDVERAAGTIGYQIVRVHHAYGEKGTRTAEHSDQLVRGEWEYYFNKMPPGSFVLFRMPIQTRLPVDLILQMKREKRLHFITVVHDADPLRHLDRYETQEEEFPFMVEVSDCLIVHNEVMARYFEGIGVAKSHLVTLEIFDYLHETEETDKVFERSVTFAGNLIATKSPFLSQLGRLAPLKIRLYGPNYSEEMFAGTNNIIYGGSIPAELLPQELNYGFGLIWDGDRIDTCSGNTGEYLRYNNPHKMSLYLAAGLPIIIWSGAAQAEFVKRSGVGITVDSLYDVANVLERMKEYEYRTMAENTRQIAERLKTGYYTRKAIQAAEGLF